MLQPTSKYQMVLHGYDVTEPYWLLETRKKNKWAFEKKFAQISYFNIKSRQHHSHQAISWGSLMSKHFHLMPNDFLEITANNLAYLSICPQLDLAL